MFTEDLQRYSIVDLMRERYGCMFPPASLFGDWMGLGPERREPILRLADEYREQPYAQLTAGQYMEFARTGNRAVMEAPYFQRRRKLIAALMGACAGDEAQTDLDIVVDGIWLICEETSWVISAHNGGEHDGVEQRKPLPLPDPARPYVDLFAAQTAMILSLTCQLLSGQLDELTPLIRRRVRAEVERRILIPFETRDDFWWMGVIRKDLCNWTPWIVSNVALAAGAWIDDVPRYCELLERCCLLMDRYLDVIPRDGGCDEGVGYWSMAAGAVLDFLELLEQQVPGWRITRLEKLKSMARFPLSMWLGGDWFVNFGDCDARPEVPGERLQYAGRRLGMKELIAFGARFRGAPTDAVKDTPQLWRLMSALRAAPKDPGEAEPPAESWLPDLEIRTLHRGGVTLACKGGVNEGSHNHNDCGSFMLFADGEPQIVDAGNMTYTRKTFSGDRYTLWNIRSKYHNVPMIGSCEQAAGWEFRAKDVTCTADGMALDIAGAYPGAAGVASLRRRFALDGDGRLVLTDEVELEAPQAVTEALLLRHEPAIEGDAVVSGPIRITPNAPMAVEVEQVPVADPRMAKNFPGSLWRAAFVAPAAARHRIQLEIERIHR